MLALVYKSWPARLDDYYFAIIYTSYVRIWSDSLLCENLLKFNVLYQYILSMSILKISPSHFMLMFSNFCLFFGYSAPLKWFVYPIMKIHLHLFTLISLQRTEQNESFRHHSLLRCFFLPYNGSELWLSSVILRNIFFWLQWKKVSVTDLE